MNRLILLLMLITGFAGGALAQYTKERLQKAKEINARSYEEIKGSPYLYEEFMYCSPFSQRRGKAYKEEWLNYNGYEGAFEIKRQGKLYGLPVQDYDSLVIHPSKEDSLVAQEYFVKNMLPGKPGFVNVLYYGRHLQLIREFKSKVELQVVETPGKSLKTPKFTRYYYYTLLKDDVPYKIRLRKADIILVLGHKKELTAYIKQHKLSMARPDDVKKLLRYYEEELAE